MVKFKVELDKKICQGFGACVELCSEFFMLSDTDGKTSIQGSKKISKNDLILKEELDVNELNCITDAAFACPFKAIHITNTDKGEKII